MVCTTFQQLFNNAKKNKKEKKENEVFLLNISGQFNKYNLLA
jgi:hypothetical protein